MFSSFCWKAFSRAFTDWWTAVGSLPPDAHVHTQGPGSALMVRAATRVLRLLTS